MVNVKHTLLIFAVGLALLQDLKNNKFRGNKTILKLLKEVKCFTIKNPYDITTDSRICDLNYSKLIDLDFKFIIKPKLNCDLPFLLIIIVPSYLERFERRKFIRRTLGQNGDVIKIVFTMGINDDTTISEDIITESGIYKDIVQGNFLDAYRNLTYKHIMGLKWVTHHCPTARYVLKSDDDVFINDRELIRLLTRQLSPWGARGLIAGNLMNSVPVQRGKTGKWYVSKEQYAGEQFPTYCSGGFIIYSQDVLPFLLEVSEYSKYIPVEDAFATGILPAKVGYFSNIGRTNIKHLYLSRPDIKQLNARKPPIVYGPFDLKLPNLRLLWNLTHNLNGTLKNQPSEDFRL